TASPSTCPAKGRPSPNSSSRTPARRSGPATSCASPIHKVSALRGLQTPHRRTRRPHPGNRLDLPPHFLRSSSVTATPSFRFTSPAAPPSFRPRRTRRQRSEGTKVLNEIRLLRRGKPQREHGIVVLDHRRQVRRTPIVEVRGMLPYPAQRRRAVPFVGGALRVRRIRANLRRIVQDALVHVREAGARIVTHGALRRAIEDDAPPLRRGRTERPRARLHLTRRPEPSGSSPRAAGAPRTPASRPPASASAPHSSHSGSAGCPAPP